VTKRLVKQTAKHERDLELPRKQEVQSIFHALGSLTQENGTIIKVQEVIADNQKYLSALAIKSKEEISKLIKEMKAIRKAQKRIQVIWVTTFLLIVVPLSAFLVDRLVYWIFM